MVNGLTVTIWTIECTLFPGLIAGAFLMSYGYRSPSLPLTITWRVYRNFTDVNFPAYIKRQDLGVYECKKQVREAILNFEKKFPDSFVTSEVLYNGEVLYR